MAKNKRVRLSLNVSPTLNDALENLAAEMDGSKSEVLRKAISLMEVAVEAKRDGHKFGVAAQDQTLLTEVVGL